MKLYCTETGHEIDIEIDGVTETYIVAFDYECDHWYEEETNGGGIDSEELTINSVETFDSDGDPIQVDYERKPQSWREQFEDEVRVYAQKNLDE